MQVRVFAEARWRSSHLDVSPNPESNSGFIPYSLHPVELFVLGHKVVQTAYSNKLMSTLHDAFLHPSQQSIDLLEKGVLSP